MTLERIILSNLIFNEDYARKVLPFLRLSYFSEKADKVLFKSYVQYHEKYNRAPSLLELQHEVSERTDISESEFEEAVNILDSGIQKEDVEIKWAVDKTEAWCQERSLYNAIMDSISIIDGDDQKRTKHAIPDMLKEALAISFNTKVGHDYIEDATKRYEFYNEEHERISFDIDILNKITNGGIPRKTLNVILAGTNVGKTLGLVHLAANYLKQGLNVLYITMEMAEEWIANRIDANLMDLTLQEVEKLDKFHFYKHIGNLKKNTEGKLIIKEYPTASAHTGHFRQLLEELKMKKKFKPDVIIVDYIGITASSRVKLGQTGSYFYVKAVAEELRGLGVEYDAILWSAVQTNRGGFGATDVDLTDTAESFGLPATADFMLAFVRTEELDELGQLLVKQLKSRYGNKNYFNKFVIGVDVDKMQLFGLDMSAQERIAQPQGGGQKQTKSSKFSGIQV